MILGESDVIMEMRGNVKCLMEGIDGLKDYSDTEIAVLIKGEPVILRGRNMYMFMLSGDRIGIRGEINCVIFGEENAE